MSWLTEPDDEWDDEVDAPRSRVKLIAIILGGWLAVSLLVLVGLLTFSHPNSDTKKAGAAPVTSAPAASASSTVPVPDGWVQQAVDSQTDCGAHAYGQVQGFFATTPCISVQRVLATTNQGGRPVVIATYLVVFRTADQAAQFNTLVAADGTGNINDLLREGKTFAGAPGRLPVASFASRQVTNHVRVAEAAFIEGKSDGNDSTLKAIAAQAVNQT
jgi:hypothetical protein